MVKQVIESINTSRETAIKIGTENAHEDYMFVTETRMAVGEEVIEECAAFPHGDHDDLVDSMTMAVMRFRQGGLIKHPEDYVEEKTAPRKRSYY